MKEPTDEQLDELGRAKLSARATLALAEFSVVAGLRSRVPDMAERWEKLADVEEALLAADRAFRQGVQERQTARRMRKGGLL